MSNELSELTKAYKDLVTQDRENEASLDDDLLLEESSPDDDDDSIELDESPEGGREAAPIDPTAGMSDAEKRAYQRGWRPDGGNKSAEEYLRYDDLIQEVKASHKEVKELKRHMDKQRELGYRQALEELERKRIEAIEYGDVDSVRHIDQEIGHARQELETVSSATDPTEQYRLQFIEKHKDWVHGTDLQSFEMRQFAQSFYEDIKNIDEPPEMKFQRLENALRTKFHDKFENRNQSMPQSVESHRSAPVRPKSQTTISLRDLDPGQRAGYEYFLKTQGKKKAQWYLKQLKQQGDI